jgi:hypothetical protein
VPLQELADRELDTPVQEGQPVVVTTALNRLPTPDIPVLGLLPKALLVPALNLANGRRHHLHPADQVRTLGVPGQIQTPNGRKPRKKSGKKRSGNEPRKPRRKSKMRNRDGVRKRRRNGARKKSENAVRMRRENGARKRTAGVARKSRDVKKKNTSGVRRSRGVEKKKASGVRKNRNAKKRQNGKLVPKPKKRNGRR